MPESIDFVSEIRKTLVPQKSLAGVELSARNFAANALIECYCRFVEGGHIEFSQTLAVLRIMKTFSEEIQGGAWPARGEKP